MSRVSANGYSDQYQYYIILNLGFIPSYFVAIPTIETQTSPLQNGGILEFNRDGFFSVQDIKDAGGTVANMFSTYGANTRFQWRKSTRSKIYYYQTSEYVFTTNSVTLAGIPCTETSFYVPVDLDTNTINYFWIAVK